MSESSSTAPAAGAPREVLSQHHFDPSVKRRVLYLLVASLVVALAAVLWSIYRWYFAFARFGPAIVWRWSGPAIGIALLALLLATFCALFLVRNRRRQLITSPQGLGLFNAKERLSLPWSDIVSIRTAAAPFALLRRGERAQIRISLRTLDDQIINLSPYLTDLAEAQQIIKKNIYPTAMNRYRELMKAGQPLEFGPLQLTRRGITYKGRSEPWQQLRDHKLERGRLIIEFRGNARSRKFSIPAARIPNIDLCVQLLRNIEY